VVSSFALQILRMGSRMGLVFDRMKPHEFVHLAFLSPEKRRKDGHGLDTKLSGQNLVMKGVSKQIEGT